MILYIDISTTLQQNLKYPDFILSSCFVHQTPSLYNEIRTIHVHVINTIQTSNN